jgi:hypothetical protein
MVLLLADLGLRGAIVEMNTQRRPPERRSSVARAECFLRSRVLQWNRDSDGAQDPTLDLENSRLRERPTQRAPTNIVLVQGGDLLALEHRGYCNATLTLANANMGWCDR